MGYKGDKKKLKSVVRSCLGGARSVLAMFLRNSKKKIKQLKVAKQVALRIVDSSHMRFLESEVNMLLDKETKMWGQWFRVLWLKDGD